MAETEEQVTSPPESPPETKPPSEPSEESELDKVAPPEEEEAASPPEKDKDPDAAAEPSEEEKRAAESKPEAKDKPPEDKPAEEKDREAAEAEKGVPEKVREAWKTAPALRGAYFRDKQFRELFQTPENAKFVHERYEAREADDKLYHSRDAGDIRKLVHQMAEQNPEAFQRFGTVLVGDSHKFYAEQLESMGRSDLAEALLEVDGVFFGGKDAKPAEAGKATDGKSGVSREREELAKERTAFRDEKRGDFLKQTQATWEETVTDRISETLNSLGADSLSEWATDNLRKNVIERLNSELGKDSIHGTRMRELIDRGSFTSDSRKEVVKAMNVRSAGLIGELVADELEKAGSETIRQSKAKDEKRRDAAARGSEPGTGGTPSKPQNVRVQDMKQEKGESDEHFENRLYEQVGADST